VTVDIKSPCGTSVDDPGGSATFCVLVKEAGDLLKRFLRFWSADIAVKLGVRLAYNLGCQFHFSLARGGGSSLVTLRFYPEYVRTKKYPLILLGPKPAGVPHRQFDPSYRCDDLGPVRDLATLVDADSEKSNR
jgi:hypothetical protein